MSVLDDQFVKLEILRMVNDGVSQSDIATQHGVARETISRFINKKTHKDWWAANDKPIASGSLYDHHHKVKTFSEKKFIITSAQNNTYVHSKFLGSLQTMAKRLSARIIVGTFSYNKTGFQNLAKGEAEWFDSKISNYIVDEPVYLADDLIWCGELNVLPTAVNPLSGFHSYTKDASGIIPHAKIQLESLPTHKSSAARMLYTTGAITQRNYIQKKSGQKASFHHIFGALLVEIDKQGDWFVRQIIADTDTGEFYDLDTLYTPEGYSPGLTVKAINWGDIHAEKGDKAVYEASFGSNSKSMLNVLKPAVQLVHDVMDFTSRNHHSINDPYFRFAQFINGKDSVVDNVKEVAEVLKMMDRNFSEIVIVESNHDLALEKWLKTADYKVDPANAVFFLSCQLATYKAIAANDKDFSVFEYALELLSNYDLSNVSFLKTDESFMIGGVDGVECGCHGDLGTNGTRGSINAFQKLGTRYNIGHSHSAAIKDGVYMAGVSGKLDMGYNRGPSSWSHSHIVTYPNSKRTIVTIKNGKWRA